MTGPPPGANALNAYLPDLRLAKSCADHLERAREAVIGVLRRHESLEAATGEIEGSIDALRSFDRDLAHYLRVGSVESVATFLPGNLPLYSLIRFGVVPSLMADRVDVHLSEATSAWWRQVADAAQLERFFPRMHLHALARRQFTDVFARHAAAVIFAGGYESAEDVRAECPHGLFIYQGSGVNPIVVGAGAQITDQDFDRIVTSRVFNAGQDCSAPDALLVHTRVSRAFVSALVDRVTAVSVGSYLDDSVRVGTILDPGPLKEVEERLVALKDDVVLGGAVDRGKCFVEPSVIVRPLSEHDRLKEFFAPIFYVLVYEDDEELDAFFARPEYVENAMYVSVFGQEPIVGMFETSTVLFDNTVLDVEQGNSRFGGNGARSNYTASGDDVIVGPLLVAEALSRIARGPVRSSCLAFPGHAGRV